MSTMKLYKLITHQKNFSVEDLILNSKELPDAKIGDVVEIFLPEDDGVRLLLQITNLNEDKSKGNKDVISIESSIASAFNLPTYSE
ncbi:GATOR complex protein Iml1-like, partial [Sitodiplosis mosellana]|uniref:GATOR complex protein Iml1-like n=1 Tax=Sitodiplosis mosellana TaxID=263140 RepID=UPI002443B0D2